ncbi:cupin domain-containing protein [Streptomyces sp. NPDC101733]|uniref:cupin domain-containing protein n=1 Tax=unclassified Streptomyces TaxID=2593676 RepID=UPI00380D9F04
MIPGGRAAPATAPLSPSYRWDLPRRCRNARCDQYALSASPPGPAPSTITDQLLGPHGGPGAMLQALVPAGLWQCVRPGADREASMSCLVTPGFDFADFTFLFPAAGRP